jgi:hypothetical protein
MLIECRAPGEHLGRFLWEGSMPTKQTPTLLSITMINWFEMHFSDDPTKTAWGWNVDLALEIAASKPLESVAVANIKHFAETYEVDVHYALSDRVDLNKPLLFVLLAGRDTARAEVRATGLPEAVLIDGVHRLTKAIHLGLEVLPAKFLEQSEEPRARLTAAMLTRLRRERAQLAEVVSRKAG